MKKLNFLAFACAISMVAVSCGNMNDTHNIPEATSNERPGSSLWCKGKTFLAIRYPSKDITG